MPVEDDYVRALRPDPSPATSEDRNAVLAAVVGELEFPKVAPADRGSREPAPEVAPREPKRTAPEGVEMSPQAILVLSESSALPWLFPTGANGLSHRAFDDDRVPGSDR